MNTFLTKPMRNPAQGVRGHRPRSTCPAWGVSSLATDRTAGDLLRGSLANPATANSSTTKGPRGLAGELCRRRSRIANGFGWWVRGCFYVRPSEMIAWLRTATCNRNYAGSGELDIQPNPLPVTRDSDVSCKVKGIANAGSSMAAGVVTGASIGRRGESKRYSAKSSDQRERTIRNRAGAGIRWQSYCPNAVEWECGLIRSRVVCKRELAVRLERWFCKAVESRWCCRVVPTALPRRKG